MATGYQEPMDYDSSPVIMQNARVVVDSDEYISVEMEDSHGVMLTQGDMSAAIKLLEDDDSGGVTLAGQLEEWTGPSDNPSDRMAGAVENEDDFYNLYRGYG